MLIFLIKPNLREGGVQFNLDEDNNPISLLKMSIK